MKRTFIALGVLGVVFGCGTEKDRGPLTNVSALVILQRLPQTGDMGTVFQYTSYAPGGRLLKLQPPTADGTISVLCCEQFAGFEQMDINSYDINFDARSIVFSGKLSDSERYGLYILTLNDQEEAAGPPAQLATDPTRDYVYPVFASLDRIVFVTNSNVEALAPQHQDEYNRGVTTQLGSISVDGSNENLGPRNLSHRVFPTVLQDGRILFTQWDHLGNENSGQLMITNPDFTNLREAFGKENRGRTNSYLKAVEIPEELVGAGDLSKRLVAIGTSRDRTIQSGKILDIKLGSLDEQNVWRQSEAYSEYTDLTPLVPGDREPSQMTVGRYYDAYPVRANSSQPWGERPFFVVSWADGPVESETLGLAGLNADFGVYLFDSRSGTRRPIFNTEDKWEILPRPLATRPAPRPIAPSAPNGYSAESMLVGSLDVHVTSLGTPLPRGEVVKVRILEGFSVEEGGVRNFGTSNHEGAALLGEADVFTDGSWAALVPANVPIHLQAIDKFGMAIVNEPVWFSGRAGESRFCGGCHEDRAATTVIQPGITEAIAYGPRDMDLPRDQRISTTYTRDQVIGVPWDLALQPIFDRECVSCHDGDPAKPGNFTITFTDEMGNMSQFVFDLRGQTVSYGVGETMLDAYTASHLSLMGPDMVEINNLDEEITITTNRPDGELPIFIEPGNARESALFQLLNPPQLYPYDPAVRFVPGQGTHEGIQLTEDEYYLLVLMADAGGQFYSRENLPN